MVECYPYTIVVDGSTPSVITEYINERWSIIIAKAHLHPG